MRENIIIGDIHGCRLEFNQLLKKIKYDKNKHRVILVGDFSDRGPDSIGLIHQIQDMQIESVLANHESKLLRWRKHEAIKDLLGTENPMKEPVAIRKKEWLALSKYDLGWLDNLPVKIHIKDNWYVVHAGMEPAASFDDQDLEKMMRIRYVDEKTLKYIKPKDKDQPKGAVFWAEKWNQPFNIIFGHTRFDEPRVFKNKNNVCIGVDTSAVFGGSLTAFSIEKNEFVSVKANKIYYKN